MLSAVVAVAAAVWNGDSQLTVPGLTMFVYIRILSTSASAHICSTALHRTVVLYKVYSLTGVGSGFVWQQAARFFPHSCESS